MTLLTKPTFEIMTPCTDEQPCSSSMQDGDTSRRFCLDPVSADKAVRRYVNSCKLITQCPRAFTKQILNMNISESPLQTLDNTGETVCATPERGMAAWARGIVSAGPIVLGYVPVGFAYGVLAQKTGLSLVQTMLISIFVYAGASQFIAVGLMAAHVPAFSIILTTLIVNLRHTIMASAIAPYLRGWRKRELAAFAYELTDETFAVHITRFAVGNPPKAEIFALNLTAQSAWVAGSLIGALTGQLIPDVRPYGLDYALTALFIALLVLQIKHWRHVSVAFLTGLLAVGLRLKGFDHWSILLAALVGATFGVILEQWKPTSSS